ncbi:MAG: diguanylate cyclase domain-containing protein [Thiohalomonadales bacterium]
MTLSIRQKHKNIEEYSQSIARVVISAIAFVVYSGLYFLDITSLYLAIFIGSIFVISSVWSFTVSKFPEHYLWRRYFVAVFDISVVSYALFISDAYGTTFFPLYLWVIVGNGMRFGTKLLLFTLFVTTFEFSFVLILSAYWQQNIPTAIGILIGIIVLPLFYLVLIRRLHVLTRELETELKKTTYAANHDDLTDLVSRNYFFQRLDEKILESGRYDYEFTVMFIDLDGFKHINDTYGHQAGDKTLQVIAQRLKSETRASDIIARLGGDEFGLLLHNMYGIEHIKNFSEKLIQEISSPFNFNQITLSVTASIGISKFPESASDSDGLINEADNTMYQSKNNGKNCYTLPGIAF